MVVNPLLVRLVNCISTGYEHLLINCELWVDWNGSDPTYIQRACTVYHVLCMWTLNVHYFTFTFSLFLVLVLVLGFSLCRIQAPTTYHLKPTTYYISLMPCVQYMRERLQIYITHTYSLLPINY